MVDYYALAGFHCDAVEDRSLEKPKSKDFDSKPYAVAPKRPVKKPLEVVLPHGKGEREVVRTV